MSTLPSAPPSDIGPVNLADRIQFIDILRGLTLFGILAANMRAFFAPIDVYDVIKLLFPGTADLWAQGFIQAFLQFKCVSIFSFLFGLGFAMQMSRAEARGASFTRFYPRRLAALALFGVIHGALIWSGDILLTYAITGGILLLLRHQPQKNLLRLSMTIFCLPMVVQIGALIVRALGWGSGHIGPDLPKMTDLRHVIAIYAHGGWNQIFVRRLIEWIKDLPLNLFALYLVMPFTMGMWVWRQNIVQTLPDHRQILRQVACWCLPAGLIVNLLVAWEVTVMSLTVVSPAAQVAMFVFFPGAVILATGYMAGLALLYLHPAWRDTLRIFAPVGRMALTNYLMQSVLCTWFFDSSGTGWFGSVGPAWGLVFTVILYALQVGASHAWLRHFHFGPMEYLWRGLTYGKFPAWRRRHFMTDTAVENA